MAKKWSGNLLASATPFLKMCLNNIIISSTKSQIVIFQISFMKPLVKMSHYIDKWLAMPPSGLVWQFKTRRRKTPISVWNIMIHTTISILLKYVQKQSHVYHNSHTILGKMEAKCPKKNFFLPRNHAFVMNFF